MYYFAYGTNLNKKQMSERCPDSKPVFTAVLPNYKLVFVGWSRQWRGGVASIKSFRGERVRGALYEISDQCLRRLDKYEGYPGNYNRLKVTVFDEDNAIEAITYIKTGQFEETQPSKEYLVVIQQGLRDWRLF
ncbi:MAG: gamma-glutamylcyclotransferase family protein [Dehalococcoidales bacterium]